MAIIEFVGAAYNSSGKVLDVDAYALEPPYDLLRTWVDIIEEKAGNSVEYVEIIGAGVKKTIFRWELFA